MGRHKMYESPEDFDAMVDAYVAECQAESKPMLFTELALFLGFSSRHSLHEYKNYPDFSRSVDRALSIIASGYERHLHGANNSGARFALTNYGWKNNSDVNVSSPDGSVSASITTTDPVEASKEYQRIMNGGGQ